MRIIIILTILVVAISACNTRYSEHRMGSTPLIDTAYQQKWLTYLDRKIKTLPNHDESYYRKALVLARLNDFESAMPFIKKAVELDPENGLYRYFHSRALLENGRFQEGLREGRMAESLEVDAPDLFVTLGALYFREGEPEKSREYLNKGLSKDPLNHDGYLYRGFLSMAEGDTASAEIDILQSLELTETQEGYNALIEISVFKKDYTNAFARLDKSLAEEPDNMDLLLRKADLLYKTGQTESSKAILLDLVSRDTTQIVYYNLLSMTYLDAYKYDSAIYYQNKALEIDNRNKEALLTLARIYSRRGYYSSARDYYNRALELDTANEAVKEEIVKLNSRIAYFQRLKAERERNETLQMVEPITITKPEL